MRPKEMEDLAAFSVREVKRAAAEERERDQYSLQKDGESQSKKSSPRVFGKLMEGGRLLGEIAKKEAQSVELVGDQNPGPEAPPKNKRGRERKEQIRYQGSSDCHKSDWEE